MGAFVNPSQAFLNQAMIPHNGAAFGQSLPAGPPAGPSRETDPQVAIRQMQMNHYDEVRRQEMLDQRELATKLHQKLGPEFIQDRPGPGESSNLALQIFN